jgi:hypothetical protein
MSNSTYLDSICFEVSASEAMHAILAQDPLQSKLPVGCEVRVYQRPVGPYDYHIILAARPPWPKSMRIADIPRLTGRTQKVYITERITLQEDPRAIVADLFAKLRDVRESVRAYFYSSLWC